MKNEVTDLYENSDIFSATSGLESTNIIRVGESVGSIFAVETQGVNPDNGRRLYVKADGTVVQYNHVVPAGQSRWTDARRHCHYGRVAHRRRQSVRPGYSDMVWRLGQYFLLRSLDLNVQMNYAGGNYIYNGSKAGLRDQRFWNNSHGRARPLVGKQYRRLHTPGSVGRQRIQRFGTGDFRKRGKSRLPAHPQHYARL